MLPGIPGPAAILLVAASLLTASGPHRQDVARPADTPAAIQKPGTPELVTRFLSGTGEPLVGYCAIRRLEAKSDRMNMEGWLVVRTVLDPEKGFHYEVLEEGGSPRVRKRVLYAALDTELRTNKAGTWSRAAFTPDNYEFAVEPAAGPLETLKVTPRRKDPVLIDGRLFVSPQDADLKRVEGVLSKTPSFWTKHVGMVRQYGRIDGVRVPLVIESVALVRILGRSEFRMTFDYESINGRPVNGGVTTATW
jgi:hypothetical protein